ncbi:hypothetical protein Tco_0327579 [Tanacetum coccineum]
MMVQLKKKRNTRAPQPSGLITNVVDETWEILLLKLVDETIEDQGRIDEEVMFDVSDLAGEEVVVAEKGVPDVATTISTAATTVTHEEITLSQALQELKTPEKPMKKKYQILFDEEIALKLQAQMQAELEEEERLGREKEEEANIALIKSWDNTRAMIDADYQLAKQLQAQKQEELTIEEKSKLFVQLLEARKKHFAALRAE